MDAQDTLIVKAQGNIYDDYSVILGYAKDGGATSHNTLQKTYVQTFQASFATETLYEMEVWSIIIRTYANQK